MYSPCALAVHLAHTQAATHEEKLTIRGLRQAQKDGRQLTEVYANLAAELAKIQQMRVEAFKALQAEVTGGVFPEPQRLLNLAEREFEAFVKGIE